MSLQPKRISDLGVAPVPRVLEGPCRLSASALWTLEQTFYRRHGNDAWAKDIVPHYITCNPWIADAYARTIAAFLGDCLSGGRLELGEPVYVVEVGAGSGRFAYHLRRRLSEVLGSSRLSDLRLTSVVTDFEDSKLRRLQDHPALKADLDSGRLDLAVLDLCDPRGLRLWQSGAVLERGRNPLVLIANYVFDSLPCDVFAVRGGRLHEGLVSISSDRADSVVGEPDDLDSLQMTWDFEEADPTTIDDPDLRAVAATYEAELDDSVFLVPTGAQRCLNQFRSIAGSSPLLALVADKGHARTQDLLGAGPPAFVTHNGCFSLMVNFDALARAAGRAGGRAYLPRHRPTSLVVGAFCYADGMALSEFDRSYAEVESGGPDDLFTLRSALQAGQGAQDIDQFLGYLRICRWDSTLLLEWFSQLLDLAATTPQDRRSDLAAALDRVWEGYFPIGEEADVAVCIGLLLSAIHYYREALVYFERSIELHGPSPRTHFAAGIAHYGLRELDAAAKSARDALALDPGFSGARSLLVSVEAEQGQAN
jgi:hypothetical protein